MVARGSKESGPNLRERVRTSKFGVAKPSEPIEAELGEVNLEPFRSYDFGEYLARSLERIDEFDVRRWLETAASPVTVPRPQYSAVGRRFPE